MSLLETQAPSRRGSRRLPISLDTFTFVTYLFSLAAGAAADYEVSPTIPPPACLAGLLALWPFLAEADDLNGTGWNTQ
jgi:hypothetical protein